MKYHIYRKGTRYNSDTRFAATDDLGLAIKIKLNHDNENTQYNIRDTVENEDVSDYSMLVHTIMGY